MVPEEKYDNMNACLGFIDSAAGFRSRFSYKYVNFKHDIFVVNDALTKDSLLAFKS